MNKLKIIKNVDIKNMLKIIKKISNKTQKHYLIIFFDIIFCAIFYGAGYYDYQEFEFYNLNHRQRKTYLTRIKNNKIIKKYNNQLSFYKFDNKKEFNKLFKDYIKRAYLVIDENKYDQFKDFTKKYKILIVKPIVGEGGKGIQKIKINSKTNLKILFNNLLDRKQILIEEYINQHHVINKLYPKAVNTLRIFTFYDDKKVHILNSVLKIGNGGVTDNFCSGGMYSFVDDNGKVTKPAIDQNDNIYYIHPITKKDILGFEIPLYQETCQLL